jgi:amino acid permease
MVTSYDYPVAVEGEYQERINRFLWLIKWILVIPNWFVLWIFSIPGIVTYPAAWLIIIITGRYPRWLWDYHFGLLRWGWRLNFYAYQMGATDQYPPFSLGDQDYPASITIEYPLSSSRLKALFRWILVIPHWIIVGILTEVVSILVFIALIIVLITGAYPRTLFDFNLGLNRWRYRVSAYGGLLRDEYPPFGIDP